MLERKLSVFRVTVINKWQRYKDFGVVLGLVPDGINLNSQFALLESETNVERQKDLEKQFYWLWH
ncbi:MAG: hypothetical protein NZ805_03780 [Armatimonadetes bacterium]|nr:hypothetical protein [Armatimonadota bacterium]